MDTPAAAAPCPERDPTYRVSAYDPPDEPEEDGWRVVASGLTRWQVRGAVRRLRSEAYDDDCSILVEKE